MVLVLGVLLQAHRTIPSATKTNVAKMLKCRVCIFLSL